MKITRTMTPQGMRSLKLYGAFRIEFTRLGSGEKVTF